MLEDLDGVLGSCCDWMERGGDMSLGKKGSILILVFGHWGVRGYGVIFGVGCIANRKMYEFRSATKVFKVVIIHHSTMLYRI